MSDHPIPVDIRLHKKSRVLELTFDDGAHFELSCEYLRVHSPSGEVRARRGDAGILISGKRDVAIEEIKMVGQYAIKLYFDDGHNSGLYDWRYLYELGSQSAEKWQHYLERLEQAGATR
ncbi:MAG: DUF971 domain-containing protein [Sedimenticola sp.]